MSSRADGAEVVMLGLSSPWVNVLVTYPNTISEFYTFNIEKKIFAHSTHKYGDRPIGKASTYIGKCY